MFFPQKRGTWEGSPQFRLNLLLLRAPTFHTLEDYFFNKLLKEFVLNGVAPGLASHDSSYFTWQVLYPNSILPGKKNLDIVHLH